MTKTDAKKLYLAPFLNGLIKHKASDLHIKVNRPPIYRINGNLVPTKTDELSAEQVERIAKELMTKELEAEFIRMQQVDFSFSVPGLSRFRVNIFRQRGSIALVVRAVPLGVPKLDNLGLPSVIKDLCMNKSGLILITGYTGSGKSTTLAAMVDYINENQKGHIITIEEPIEFIHRDRNCSITQREVGTDAKNLNDAFKASLRQDPDVIVVGEMRDYRTIKTAISASETGHLVISTLHTRSAAQSIDRIVDSFPAEAKTQVRLQLANSLLAVVSQKLVRRGDGNGQICASEILIKSPNVSRLIYENNLDQLYDVMESSSEYYKMQSMNQSLVKLVNERIITVDEAVAATERAEDLRLKLSGMVGGGHKGVGAETLMECSEETESGELNESGVSLESLDEFDSAS